MICDGNSRLTLGRDRHFTQGWLAMQTRGDVSPSPVTALPEFHASLLLQAGGLVLGFKPAILRLAILADQMTEPNRSPTRAISLTMLLYRLAMSAAAVMLRVMGKRDPFRAERLALVEQVVPAGAVWVHGASVGELNSAQVIIKALAAEMPLLVTANTQTGRAVAQGWGMTASLAPFDAIRPTRRFIDNLQPSVMVTIENEIWPIRSWQLGRRGAAQVVIGARMSARSARRWSRLRGVIGPVLHRIDLLSAQDAETEERLLALGLRPEALAPQLNLKLLAPARIRPGPPGQWRDRTLLAASTHEGEEALILTAWEQLRRDMPDIRLILAPRHPGRGDELAAMIAGRGLDFARRSTGGDESVPLLLADTLGEMGRWYDAAAICVTGGSFVDRGGHTPWEPAAHGCALLHGPHIANFRDDYARLDAAGGSLATDPGSLADAVSALIADPALSRGMGGKARACLIGAAGDPQELIAAIVALSNR